MSSKHEMKKACIQVIFTLFFSSLTGIGLAAGVLCFFALAELLSRVMG